MSDNWDLFAPSPAPGAKRTRTRSRQPKARTATATPNGATKPSVLPLALNDGHLTPAPSGTEGWTVSAVNAAARELIEGVFPPLWVRGEVTNFTRARSGHCYFSLRDSDSQIRCVMWRDEARRLPTTPVEGMQVRVLGHLSLYEARGEFQLVVAEVDAEGDGLWKLAFDRLRDRLDAEGLLAPDRKRPLPRFPSRIGVVTSPTGAAFRDIVAVIRRRAPWTEIVLCGCRVQGDGAADEIAAAIRYFGEAQCADVLIVGRGGGSIEDLWAFNEETVARAVAESPIPTVSAVGHEIDYTILDLVADLRAPTPSAAAEALAPDGAALRRQLAQIGDRLSAEVELGLRVGVDRLSSVRGGLTRGIDRRVADAHRQVRAVAAHLESLSPLRVLARGFALPLRPDGSVLRRRSEFAPGAPFELRVSDGSVPCRTEAE